MLYILNIQITYQTNNLFDFLMSRLLENEKCSMVRTTLRVKWYVPWQI